MSRLRRCVEGRIYEYAQWCLQSEQWRGPTCVVDADNAACAQDLGSEGCDAACNAHARASVRALELGQAQVPARLIEAMLVGEFGLSEAEAADIVTDLASDIAREGLRGLGGLAEYIWAVGMGRVDPRKVTSSTLAAAVLLAKHHLGLDYDPPSEEVRRVLEQARVDAQRAYAKRGKRGHLTVAGRAA